MHPPPLCHARRLPQSRAQQRVPESQPVMLVHADQPADHGRLDVVDGDGPVLEPGSRGEHLIEVVAIVERCHEQQRARLGRQLVDQPRERLLHSGAQW